MIRGKEQEDHNFTVFFFPLIPSLNTQSCIRRPLCSTVDGKGSLSNNFSVIFPSFVHLLATKHMAKQSRASGQLSGGHWVE